MATSSQLAARKIKAPKSRIGRSVTPTGPPNAFSGSFGQSTTSSFPPPSDNIFGASVETSSSQAPIFGGGSNGSVFTFGASNNTTSNPFQSENQANNPFGGGNISSSFPAPTQQNASNGLFSKSFPNQSTSNGIFGGFTNGAFNNNSAQDNEMMHDDKPHNASTTTPSNAGLFGAGFGSSQSAKAPLFNFQSTTANSSLRPDTGSNDNTKPLFSFGAQASSQNGSNSVTSTTTTPFMFGQSASTAQPATETSQPKIGSSLFGGGPFNAPAPATNFRFGTTSVTPTPEPESAPVASVSTLKTTSLFGQPLQPVAATNDSEQKKPLFGQPFSQSKPALHEPIASATSVSQSEALDDHSVSASASQPIKPANPFANIFAPRTGEISSEPTMAAVSTPKPLFSFGTPASRPDLDKQNTNGETKALFGATPTAQASVKPSLFAPQSSIPPGSASTASLSAHEAQQPLDTSDQSTTSRSDLVPTPITSQPMFTPAPTKTSASMFTSPSSVKTSSQPATIAEKITPNAFSQSTYKTQSIAKSSEDIPQSIITRTVSTEGPPQIPSNLPAHKYKAYDECWRLRALNRRFHEVLVGLNPDKHDFMNVIRNYLDHRESIGQGMAGYERPRLGTKRKADRADSDTQMDDTSKRAKSGDKDSATAPSSTPSAFTTATTPSMTNDLFKNFTSSSTKASSPNKNITRTDASDRFRSMIPGASAVTDSPPANTQAAPSFEPFKSTTPPNSPPKNTVSSKSGFVFKPSQSNSAPSGPASVGFVPKFGSSNTSNGVDFMSSFGKAAEATQKKLDAKRKAEEFDSDDSEGETDEAYEKRIAEEKRAKKAKLDSIPKMAFSVSPALSATNSKQSSPAPFTLFGSKQPSPTPSADFAQSIENGDEVQYPTINGAPQDTTTDDPTDTNDDTADDSADGGDIDTDHIDDESGDQGVDDENHEQEEEEEQGSPIEDQGANSLFNRVTGRDPPKDQPILQSPANNSFGSTVMFSGIGKSTPTAPVPSPVTPATAFKSDSAYKPPSTFSFTPTRTNGVLSTDSSSVFGGATSSGPIRGEGLFGSRPSTPSNAEKIETVANGTASRQSFGTPGGDNSWSVSDGIKFASTPEKTVPSMTVTSATPPASQRDPAKPFAGLFNFSSTAPANTAPSLFANPSTSYLAAHSSTPSRQSSPGLTSEAESGGGDTDVEGGGDEQNVPLTTPGVRGAGEEEEEILFESQASLFGLYADAKKAQTTKAWNSMGSGNLRLLKHEKTGKTRMVLRSTGNATVLLNMYLMKTVKYEAKDLRARGQITFPTLENGKMETRMLKIGKLVEAQRLAGLCETNKGN